jgi:hypothetical protein
MVVTTLRVVARAGRILLSLAFVIACVAIPVAAQTPVSSSDANFAAVSRHLRTGGPFFVHVEYEGELEKVANELRGSLIKRFGAKNAPAWATRDYIPVLAKLGLLDIKAIGASSTHIAGGFHNRQFIHAPEPRRGLLNLFGTRPAPFTTARMASPDTDLFLEFEVDMPAAVALLYELAVELGFEGITAAFDAGTQMHGVLGWAPLLSSLFDLQAIELMKGRVTLAVALPISPPATRTARTGGELAIAWLQASKIFLRVEGIGTDARAALDNVDALTATADGDLRVYEIKDPSLLPIAMRPAVAIEGTTFYLATDRAVLLESVRRRDGLDTTPGFRDALAATATEGNAVAYITPNFVTRLGEMSSAASADAASEIGRFQIVEFLMVESMLRSTLTILDDKPLVEVMTVLPDGLLTLGRRANARMDLLLSLGIYNPQTLRTIARLVPPLAQMFYVGSGIVPP